MRIPVPPAPPLPAARFAPNAVFDTARGVSVVFGGRSGGVTVADLWDWNGAAWVGPAKGTVPPSRYFGATAYDSTRAKVMIFGGVSIADPGAPALYLSDLWER